MSRIELARAVSPHLLPARRRWRFSQARSLRGTLLAAVVLCAFGVAVAGFGHHLITADHGADEHVCVVCKLQSSTNLACDLLGAQPAPAGRTWGEALPLPPALLSYLTGPPLRGPPAC